MNIEEFYSANETIERDPVKRLNARVDQICKQVLPEDLLPACATDGRLADVRAAILSSRLAAVHNRAREAIERGRADLIESILADFANDLRAGVRFEREHGALKQMTAVDALKPWLSSLEKHGWRGPERAAILAMLEQGEEPTDVDFYAVPTNHGRKITRDTVRNWALGQRPKWQVALPGSLLPSEYLARAGFPTDEQIEKLERVAKQVESQQYVRTSGPGHMVGKEYR